MAKLVIFFFLAALIAAASATTYTTVVTTTVDENPSCQEVRSMKMKHCRMWMMQGMGMREMMMNPYPMQEHLQECCSEVKNVSTPCRCEAIRKMVMDMQQKEGMQGKMEQMRQMAESLPKMCMMKSPTECPIRAVLF